MKLWRLTRKPYEALDGSGPANHGARWTSPGLPCVNFASDAGLAVLVTLRYLPPDLSGIDQDYRLGWTEIDAVPQRLEYDPDPVVKRRRGDDWLRSKRSLLATVTSAVLPECDIILMNPLHEDAARVQPLTSRPFRFEDCLKRSPHDARTIDL